ncbi:MAG: C2H2-type zinc finger protein [Alistipes sp.]|nr:C2H2-type zinc finger protein [Alistipes sp.]
MSDVKNISVKVCGNPQATGGFMPISTFNSPNFQVLDVVYGGFHMNSYFFSIKIEPTQTIYKIIKNNVRSNGSVRQGSLVIAISIPKGYRLDNNITPYDVLKKLLDTFISLCMTCKDQATGTYEYNSGIIKPTILDDVAREYRLVPHVGPHRVMRVDTQNIGYITADEAKIRQLMSDVQYSTFANFSEVLVATSSTAVNYAHIANIEIPRVKEFRIIDGVKNNTVIRDLNSLITGKGSKDERYYKNLTVTFTIGALLRGENIDNVKLDMENETVTIDAKNLSEPLERKIHVVTSPSSIKPKDIEITTAIGKLNLNADSSFTLRGEQLEVLSNPINIRPSYVGGGSYIVTNASLRNDEYVITLEQRVQKPVAGYGNNSASVASVNAREIIISLGENTFADNSKKIDLTNDKISYRIYTSKSDNELSKLRGEDRLVKNPATGRYECSLYIPKSWSTNLFVHVTIDKCSLESRVKPIVGSDQFVADKFELSHRHNSKADTIVVKLLLMFILGILVGFGVGYLLFGLTSSKKSGTKIPAKHEQTYSTEVYTCDMCGEEFNSEDLLNKHMDEIHQCPKCPERFVKKTDRDNHVKTHNSTQKPTNRNSNNGNVNRNRSNNGNTNSGGSTTQATATNTQQTTKPQPAQSENIEGERLEDI